MGKNKDLDEVEKKLEEWAKARPAGNIGDIQKTIQEWKKEPTKMIQAKAIVAEKIADKTVYDQILVMGDTLFTVGAAIQWPEYAICITLTLFVVFVILWMVSRSKSDYYNELEVILKELDEWDKEEAKEKTKEVKKEETKGDDKT